MDDLKILAVDDSPTMRRFIVNTLRHAGYLDVTEATDGKDALAKMAIDKYNFIITDWNMPGMDGIALVKHLRSKQETKKIPVLMVTRRSVKEDIMEALRAGVNNYVVKPFTPGTIKEKIDQTLANL